jgi:UDP-N-acetylglucosamine--N-acetylmuramyl-(pentapeptide) pyrophosphoryl-undecaprenol N-acetylglucosamine transferase
MRILLTGGGTGGHIYPALALYRHLIGNYNREFNFLYVGTSQGLEQQLIPRENIPFRTVAGAGLSRSLSLKNLAVLGKVAKGIGQSFQILKEFDPQVVVGTGGYVCGPVVLMAGIMGIPTVIHEQNAFPGVTNKLLARTVKHICLTFPEAEKYFAKYKHKIVVTGLPIRPQILKASRTEAIKRLGLTESKKTILVVGGSRGAKKINEAMLAVIREFSNNTQVQIVMVTGQLGYDDFCFSLAGQGLEVNNLENIIVKPYLNEMEDGLAVSDLVISRAGAAFLAEITALGIPAILIPYPYAAENHQEYNARSLVDAGGAVMIKDQDLEGQLLLSQIKNLLGQPELLVKMGKRAKALGKPDAGDSLAQVVLKAAGLQEE